MLPTLLPDAHYHIDSPGRVNLLGEHVDYNDGIVLPVAIDRSVHLQARVVEPAVVRLKALDLGAEIQFNLTDLESKLDAAGNPLPEWALYPAGIAWAALRAGLPVTGIEAVYTSTIPIGSGLSSSAAVEVGFGALWQAAGQWPLNRLELAQLCLESERQFVGVNCGLMDQFASACGVPGQALYFDTRSLEYHPVPLPPRTAIVIADSGIRRSLTASAYNDRRAACEQAVHLLKFHLPAIRSLRDVSPLDFDRFSSSLPDLIEMRARHVVEEIARVEIAGVCLQNGDADGFGRLMLACHASLRDLYQVSIPELDELVAIAAALPGCWGARLTGAGFGGCTVNLVEESHVDDFIRQLSKDYERQTGKIATVYLCHARQGVTVTSL